MPAVFPGGFPGFSGVTILGETGDELVELDVPADELNNMGNINRTTIGGRNSKMYESHDVNGIAQASKFNPLTEHTESIANKSNKARIFTTI